MYVDLTHTQKRYANYSLNVTNIIANRKQNVNLLQNFFADNQIGILFRSRRDISNLRAYHKHSVR